MQILSNTKPSNQLSLWAHPNAPKKPVTERWCYGETYGSTESFVKAAPNEVDSISSLRKATYTFTDGTTTQELTGSQRSRLKKQGVLSAIQGALAGGLTGFLVAGFASAQVGNVFSGVFACVVAGIGAALGGLAGGSEARNTLDRSPEEPLEKQIEGTVSVCDGKVFFQPNGQSEKINLTEFQFAEANPKSGAGKPESGEQWWNKTGVAQSTEDAFFVDGTYNPDYFG